MRGNGRVAVTALGPHGTEHLAPARCVLSPDADSRTPDRPSVVDGHLIDCLHEAKDHLPAAVFPRSNPSVLAVPSLGGGTRVEPCAHGPAALREPDQRILRHGCNRLRGGTDCVHAGRERPPGYRETVGPAAGCARGWSLARASPLPLHAGTETRRFFGRTIGLATIAGHESRCLTV